MSLFGINFKTVLVAEKEKDRYSIQTFGYICACVWACV